jgi:DNA-binding MarR family transcriptional regulator
MAKASARTLETAHAEAVVDGLLAAGRMLVAHTARSLAQLDANVTLPQFRALVVLATAGPQRVVDLATELEVQPSTATRMCDRLVRKQLVSRHERPEDRRAAWLVLTPTGRNLIAEIMRRRREEIAALLASVTIPDTQGFAAGLNALVVAGGELPEAQWWQQWATSAATAEDFQQPQR